MGSGANSRRRGDSERLVGYKAALDVDFSWETESQETHTTKFLWDSDPQGIGGTVVGERFANRIGLHNTKPLM